MLLRRLYIYCSAVLLLTFASCKKDGFTPLTDTKPDIPVTVSNASYTFTVPTVTSSNANGGNITITLAIPEGSGRTIKEITRVAAATSYKSVEVTTGLYNTAPIPGNGTSVTFTTSLAEYKAKTNATVPAANTANSILPSYFYFLITLDNGQKVIPAYVKVLVVE